ncbi:hypothetical protein [Companilactobacillus furfuricola]|uniref:hypothetical protein n=1 Tax=Companilactobacillus furfuricola TaxID=1462575 RepID=UPI000F7A8684|nr:hypothetical protein [Companilactobacillus furfuricola]
MLLNKILIALVFICVATILGSGKTNSANAEKTAVSTKAEIINVNENNNRNNFNIYVKTSFKDKHKLLTIHSPQYEKISTTDLKAEIGESNVVEDVDLKQITVNLKDLDKDNFHLHFHDTNVATLSVYDIHQDKIATASFSDLQTFTQDSKTDPYTWTKRNNLQVSYGHPIKKQSDGSILKPVIYFGSITNALNHFSVQESVNRDRYRSSRKNNVTAANSGVVVLDNSEKNIINNIFYTSTSGDVSKYLIQTTK